ncbi:MAG: sialate O-acetylesterase [Algibacter sp.]
MKKHIKSIVTIICISISCISFAQEQIDLFILAGQSNAQGWKGDGSSYPTDSNGLDSQIRLNSTFIKGNDNGIDDLDTGGWVTMQAQPGRYTSGHFGPEVIFSRNLKLAGFNPAIFKYSKGATSLYGDWKQPGDGGYYDDMVIALNAAITELENLGHTVNVRAFIWIQGESDVNDTYSVAYQSNLTNLINDLRNNVVYNNALPIVLGVDDARDRNVDITDIQKNIAGNDDNIIFTSMVGLPKSDATHLTPAGLVEQGEVIFDDYKSTFISNSDETCFIEQGARTGTASLVNGSWGQSFTPSCDGILDDITFDSQTLVSGGAILTIGTGDDCTGTILSTKTISALSIGNNIVAVGDVSVVAGTTYYFKVTTIEDGATFVIDFSNANPYAGGLLSTHAVASDKSLCDRAFVNFDWKFSIGISAALSVSDVLINQTKIYPNPVKDIFTITNSQDAVLEVYNIVGELIFRIKIRSHEQFVDVSDFNNGLYFVKINNNGIITSKKIIKK